MRPWAVLRNLGPWLLLGLPSSAVGEEVEPLPADFLEYLVNFESDDDDWTLFDDKESKETQPSEADQRPRTSAPPARTPEEDKP